MTVELIYDRDCPNVAKARSHLIRALAQAGREPRWIEWDRGEPSSPAHVKRFGSPTILVDGADVAGVLPSEGRACCRLYSDDTGRLQGVPPVDQITDAIRKRTLSQSDSTEGGAGWKSSLATIPGIVLAFLPNLSCPVCWPVYAGLLTSLGLGFMLDTAYLLPLTVMFLLVAVGALALRAKARRGYGPFAVGLIAASVVLLGKFAMGSEVVMYTGIALLVAASVWNAWPLHRSPSTCPACSVKHLETPFEKGATL